MAWKFHEYPENWNEVSEECKARDNNRCVNCGQPRGGRYKLNAHHIISLRQGGTNTLDNLVTLCEACHASVHSHYARNLDIEPRPLTDRYYDAISRAVKPSKKLMEVPDENKPLKRVDIPLNAFYGPMLAKIYAKQYGGYFSDIISLDDKKYWMIYIAKDRSIKDAKNLIGIENARIELQKLKEEKKIKRLEAEERRRVFILLVKIGIFAVILFSLIIILLIIITPKPILPATSNMITTTHSELSDDPASEILVSKSTTTNGYIINAYIDYGKEKRLLNNGQPEKIGTNPESKLSKSKTHNISFLVKHMNMLFPQNLMAKNEYTT